jgi:hypothetical protein
MKRTEPALSISGLLLLLLSACSSASIAPSPSPESSVVPSAASVSSPGTSALEGVWHTGVVTQDDMRAVLHDAGFPEAIQPFFAFWKPGETNVFTLRISGGQWACYWSKDGGIAVDEDSGRYTISGDTVSINHNDEGTDVHRWSVNGGTLTITYVSDTFDDPVTHGEEIFQRVLYMSSSWTRGAP